MGVVLVGIVVADTAADMVVVGTAAAVGTAAHVNMGAWGGHTSTIKLVWPWPQILPASPALQSPLPSH